LYLFIFNEIFKIKCIFYFNFSDPLRDAMDARQDPKDIPLLNPERTGKMMQAANEFDGVANELDGNASTRMRRAAELIQEAFQHPTVPVRPIAGLQPPAPPQQENLVALAAMTMSLGTNGREITDLFQSLYYKDGIQIELRLGELNGK
jgi:hypothetical protein